MLIKSIRSTISLATDIQPPEIGDVMDYQGSLFEVISILNFHLEKKENDWLLIIDYVCQNLNYKSDKKIKAVDRITTILHPFELSFSLNNQDAYEKFRLGRGFHHRGGYFQILRYTNIKRKDNLICIGFEALPIEPLPQFHVKDRLKKEKKSRITVVQLNHE